MDYTPYGYLANPRHRASSWHACAGGSLRTAVECAGVEWVYPWYGDPRQRIGLALPASVGADFSRLRCTHHTARLLGYTWPGGTAHVFLADPDALCLRAQGAQPCAYAITDGASLAPIELSATPRQLSAQPQVHVAAASQGTAVLARGDDLARAEGLASQALASAERCFAQLQSDDATFLAASPQLQGDWPATWAEELHHDLQTARLLVQPAQGIFRDVWPAWMLAWPRAVLAEGTLDMLRLGYVNPALAQRAVLSLFRDAPAPNVPCVFAGGEFNMVAADSSRCGTSPAWCLPLLNVELLYLRTLDRAWLAALYPYLARYVEWWLDHRTDPDGWAVYKCTWEAGEDGNPRLDPSGSGSADISGQVRPVELQATLAHAANVLAFLSDQLDLPDAGRWRQVEHAYRRRTRTLFNPAEGRYQDQVLGAPCPATSYWGIDPCRWSALGLSPLLIGEPLSEAEVWAHARPPWSLWPSWTYVLVECAAAAGLRDRLGELIFSLLERVYPITTRRNLDSIRRPLPGASPEFWPEAWQDFTGHDAYGWGGTTANLLIRHLFGFQESRRTAAWTIQLAPSLPAALDHPGARYAIAGLHARGQRLDLAYTVAAHGELQTELHVRGAARTCRVWRVGQPEPLYQSRGAAEQHTFTLRNAGAYQLEFG